MTFEIEGILHKKFDVESKSSSFQTREFVITTEGTYPQYVKFQLTQDKCGVIDPCEEGEKVKVSFDLRGREWQGKYLQHFYGFTIAAELRKKYKLLGLTWKKMRVKARTHLALIIRWLI